MTPETCTTSNTSGTDSDETANVALVQRCWDTAYDLVDNYSGGSRGFLAGAISAALQHAAASAAPTLPADVKGQDEWHSPDEIPDTPKGTERNFIVAVRRARNGQVYSFPLVYLNAYQLRYEYECPKGDGCEGDGCDDGCPTTGWYNETGDGDDGSTYSPMHMDPGDEFLGWRQVPQWPAASRLHHEMAEG